MAAAARPKPSFVRQGSSSLTTASSVLNPVGSFSATAASNTSTPTPPPHLQMDTEEGSPTIYTAVYSGVQVYEMTVRSVAVMRRRDDSWLNATQILKVAGVEKGKRTKVLEKEVLPGLHEKVQGGYGKYQGTWIEFERGREFCRQYGVDQILAPLLNLDVKATGVDATPTKEQAMAARRKRMYNTSLNQSNGSGGSLPLSSTVTSAFNALHRASSARVDSPAPRQSSFHNMGSSQNDSTYASQSQQSWAPPSLPQDISYASQSQVLPDSTYASQLPDSQQDAEPPRKRARGDTPPKQFGVQAMDVDHFHQPSQAVSNHNSTSNNNNSNGNSDEQRPYQPLNPQNYADFDECKRVLMDLFINSETDSVQNLGQMSGERMDLPLDSQGNPAIHWAASLARIPLIRALVAKGASIYRVNDAGETALIRGCFCTNNFDQSTFPQLLNILFPTIAFTDNNGRTILHHIALKSGMKGRSADGRYYLHSLLEFVAKHGAASSSNRSGGPRVMNLARFVTEVVNAQDSSGDTALNIAARIGNKGIVQQLLEVSADSSIPNRAGLRPVDFGIGGEPVQQRGKEQPWQVPSNVVQKREDIVKKMKEIIVKIEEDFQNELKQKADQVSNTLDKLREATLKNGRQKEAMETIQEKVRKHAMLRQSCENLRRATDEETQKLGVKEGDVNGKLIEEVNGSKNADSSYVVNVGLLPTNPDPKTWTTQEREYVKSLPKKQTLTSWTRGYTNNEDVLREKVSKLHDRSTDLEAKFRRVVALCVGVPEDKVDTMLEALVQAVESDPGEVDTARVSNFLRKVDEI